MHHIQILIIYGSIDILKFISHWSRFYSSWFLRSVIVLKYYWSTIIELSNLILYNIYIKSIDNYTNSSRLIEFILNNNKFCNMLLKEKYKKQNVDYLIDMYHKRFSEGKLYVITITKFGRFVKCPDFIIRISISIISKIIWIPDMWMFILFCPSWILKFIWCTW